LKHLKLMSTSVISYHIYTNKTRYVQPFLTYHGVHKKCDALTKIVTAKLPVNEIFFKLVRSISPRECDQPGPFLIIRLEVTAV
jgi:hypothetical protein